MGRPTILWRNSLVLILILAIIAPEQVSGSSAMKRLYEDLFTDYNRLILPVASNKTKVTVTLGLKLGQILDLNLKQQILSTNVWVEQTWHDYKLQWEPALYDNIDMIHVPAENIWIPDIVLFNNADGNYELTLVAKARLYSNGTVVWKPPTMFRSTCEIDVKYFPFDIQTCFLRFGSWTYAGDELELKHIGVNRKVEIGIDLSQFYKNVEWDIIDVPAYYNENHYDCCEEPFPDITFKIVIRRKMLFYLVNLILPVALMTFMTVSVFYLPSDSNEKVTLSISILTSLIVFFLLMLEIIPASSLAVPLFGKYLLFTLVLVSFSACVSVYVLNIHHRSPSVHVMSPRVRNIFLKHLPRLLRLNQPDPRERSSLNRFRKKKIAQQLLKASAANKVYDLAQPLATSLNLIETLHKSYDFNPKDDTAGKLPGFSLLAGDEDEDDNGRYFRRYVDNYIERMQKAKDNQPAQSNNKVDCHCRNQSQQFSCCQHNKCCPRANQPLNNPNDFHQGVSCNNHHTQSFATTSCCGNGLNLCWLNESSDTLINNNDTMATLLGGPASLLARSQPNADFCRTASSGCTGQRGSSQAQLFRQQEHQQHSSSHMLQDDTLDMTFDYDEQDQNQTQGFLSSMKVFKSSNFPNPLAAGSGMGEDDDELLPSPPPPPRQLAQLSDSIHQSIECLKATSRMSACGDQGIDSSEDEESFSVDNIQQISQIRSNMVPVSSAGALNHGELVDKLINSINLINNASDELDSTTTSNNEPNVGDENNQCTSFNMPSLVFGKPNILHQTQQAQSVQGNNHLNAHPRADCCAPGNRFHNSKQTSAFQCTCNTTSITQNRRQHHMQHAHSSSTSTSTTHQQQQRQQQQQNHISSNCQPDFVTSDTNQQFQKPSDLLLSLRFSYDQMPPHVRAAIRSILFIADTIKNEDDENSAIEDWESMSMVVDRLFLIIFFILCTFGSVIILALAPSLRDTRASIDDKLRIDIPPSNCSATYSN